MAIENMFKYHDSVYDLMWVSPIEYVKILQSQIVNPSFHTLFIFFLIGWHIKTFYQR